MIRAVEHIPVGSLVRLRRGYTDVYCHIGWPGPALIDPPTQMTNLTPIHKVVTVGPPKDADGLIGVPVLMPSGQVRWVCLDFLEVVR